MTDKEVINIMSEVNIVYLLKTGELHKFINSVRPVFKSRLYDVKQINTLVGLWLLTHKE